MASLRGAASGVVAAVAGVTVGNLLAAATTPLAAPWREAMPGIRTQAGDGLVEDLLRRPSGYAAGRAA